MAGLESRISKLERLQAERGVLLLQQQLGPGEPVEILEDDFYGPPRRVVVPAGAVYVGVEFCRDFYGNDAHALARDPSTMNGRTRIVDGSLLG